MVTWIVGAIVLCAVVLAVFATIRNRKKSKGCGNGCAGCERSDTPPEE